MKSKHLGLFVAIIFLWHLQAIVVFPFLSKSPGESTYEKILARYLLTIRLSLNYAYFTGGSKDLYTTYIKYRLIGEGFDSEQWQTFTPDIDSYRTFRTFSRFGNLPKKFYVDLLRQANGDRPYMVAEFFCLAHPKLKGLEVELPFIHHELYELAKQPLSKESKFYQLNCDWRQP